MTEKKSILLVSATGRENYELAQELKEIIDNAISSMETTIGTPDFVSSYQEFMSVISSHITVFSPLLAVLAGLLA